MTVIKTGKFTIDQVSKSSSVNTGYNMQIGHYSVLKRNEGNGTISGNKNQLHHNHFAIWKKASEEKAR